MSETVNKVRDFVLEKCDAHKKNPEFGYYDYWNDHLRSTIEETCISDADALAHFDRIPSLFSLAYNIHKMKLDEGRDYVKSRLIGDYNGLSEQTKQIHKERITALIEALFVD